VKYWEIIAKRLSNRGYSCGWIRAETPEEKLRIHASTHRPSYPEAWHFAALDVMLVKSTIQFL
jgi:hypothetical protein